MRLFGLAANQSSMHFGQIIQELSIFLLPLLLGITLHEVAHGYVAYLLGDPTAKKAGRLTLNPLKHLDPLGLMVLLITRKIGWAKPVPINPAYFKNLKKGLLLVSIAGPGANFILAICFWLLLKLVTWLNPNPYSWLTIYFFKPLYLISSAGVIVNIILGVFNLIPIPPLDGSKILAYFLPEKWTYTYLSWEKYGFIVLILFLFTGLFNKFLNIVLNFIYFYILG
ncbi:MAG: hypothetical protein PWR24_1537 [Desulfonauticus sp.]|nr:MAG: Peptidase M50 [Desulfonauticus sp. 38_4375]MDK2921980.1 hypothetical protein [Desulfonauticus sp.]